jgi:hypothetical protein
VSSCEKVFNFCLVKSAGRQQVEVFFEVGKVRAPANGLPFPCSSAGAFEDLQRPTLLSVAAETGAIQILDKSALVQDWVTAQDGHDGGFGACIDAPSGFALPNFERRHTEAQGVNSFPTPSYEQFQRELVLFCDTQNNTRCDRGTSGSSSV